jgi:hypothetical protein
LAVLAIKSFTAEGAEKISRRTQSYFDGGFSGSALEKRIPFGSARKKALGMTKSK